MWKWRTYQILQQPSQFCSQVVHVYLQWCWRCFKECQWYRVWISFWGVYKGFEQGLLLYDIQYWKLLWNLQMTFLKTKKGNSFAMESMKGQLSLLNIPSFTAKAILKLLELYDFIVLGKKRKNGMMKKLEPFWGKVVEGSISIEWSLLEVFNCFFLFYL